MDDPISAAAIERDLKTRVIGRRVVYHARVRSTNDIARQLAEAGEPEGTLVIADEQTAGRGRLGRTWVAPAGSSILMSLLLRPALAPTPLTLPQVPRITMAVSLGAVDAIRAETGLDTQLKWPNDLLANGKKCAGILAEGQIVGEELEYVIVGIGINVNFAARSIVGIPLDATTLADELGKPTLRVPLVRAILRSTDAYYTRLAAGEDLRAEWAGRLATLHQRVTAKTPWGEETGIAQDVDTDGALILQRADGSQVRLIAGDVTLNRKA